MALQYLQGWIGIIGLVAFGNTVSCFRSHQFLADKLYTGSPEQVNALMGRLFGVWTLLSAVLRICCAVDIKNRTVYNLTFFSFVLAFVHFIVECFIYKTAPLKVGVLMPLAVSAISMIWMGIGYVLMSRSVETGDSLPSKKKIPKYMFAKPKSL